MLLSLSFSCVYATEQSPEFLFEQANSYYQRSNYNQAVVSYEAILKMEKESDDLYLNLGNSYYKLGKVTDALISYERGLRRTPNNNEIKNNIHFVRSQLQDVVVPIPKFVLFRALETLRDFLSSKQWAWLAVVSMWLCCALVLIFLVKKTISTFQRRVFVLGGLAAFACFFLALCLGLWQHLHWTNKHEGIVNKALVSVLEHPQANAPHLFELHEGSKVTELDSKQNWVKIRLEDGRDGWTLKNNLTKI